MNKSKIIYDSIHGMIRLSPICIQIIDTPEFQKLRSIHQLGTCYYVFSGASHKRFEHSIGVCYLARQWIEMIKNNHPDLEISEDTIEILQIAGLCHDLGHGPFSHIFDNGFLPKFVDSKNPLIIHENRSCLIFKRIVKKYNIALTDNDIEKVIDLIEPKKFIVEPKWVYSIVSNCFNGIDVDKFDYIQRDTKQIGLNYGFDFQSLFKLTRIIDHKICYPLKMIFEINNLFQTRYRLHNEIYNHPVVKSIEYMIIDIFCLCNDHLKISESVSTSENWEKFCRLDDTILVNIENLNVASSEIETAKTIIRNIKLRKLYKYVGEINLKIPIEIKDLNDILAWISNHKMDIPDFKLIKDDIIIHSLDLSYHFNPFDHVDFYDPNTMKILEINREDYCNIRPINDKKIRLFCRNLNKMDDVKRLLETFKTIYYDKCKTQKLD